MMFWISRYIYIVHMAYLLKKSQLNGPSHVFSLNSITVRVRVRVIRVRVRVRVIRVRVGSVRGRGRVRVWGLY